MSKIKKLISILASAVMCFATLAFISCNSDESSSTPVNTESSDTGSSDTGSEEEAELDCYVFIVKNADGTPATNAQILICKGDEGCLGQPTNVDANGKLSIKPSDYSLGGVACGADEYDIHLYINYTEIEYEETNKKTPAAYGEITLTVKAD